MKESDLAKSSFGGADDPHPAPSAASKAAAARQARRMDRANALLPVNGGQARQHLILFPLAGLIVVVDFLLKSWVVNTIAVGSHPYSWGPLSITHLRNPGAAWSLGSSLSNMAVVLSIVGIALATAFASALWRTTSWLWGVSLALLLGGDIGNLLDRFLRAPGPFRGHVIDYISVGNFPVFNVADAAITVGAVLLFICLVRKRPLRHPAEAASSPHATEAAGVGDE